MAEYPYKTDFIKRYGAAAYEKHLQQRKDWYADNRDEEIKKSQEWAEMHPEQIRIKNQQFAKTEKHKELNRELDRKGGKYYEVHKRIYNSTGLQRLRNLIRRKHASRYQLFKKIIAPGSQIHHEWTPGTADYRGTALVETNQHQYGFIDVIRILEGEITLFSEVEIRGAF